MSPEFLYIDTGNSVGFPDISAHATDAQTVSVPLYLRNVLAVVGTNASHLFIPEKFLPTMVAPREADAVLVSV
jgi:hypothetical protein